MLEILGFLEFCLESIPILKALAMRSIKRRIEIEVYQPDKPIFTNYFSHVNDRTYCLLLPFFLRITNHNRANVERVRRISFRIKRRGLIRNKVFQEFLVFDEGWESSTDIRINPLDDFKGSRCVYGEMNASTLYAVVTGETPLPEVVFHLVGGAVRRYYQPIPWDWVWVPATAPLRRLNRIGEFAEKDTDNDDNINPTDTRAS